MAILALAVVLVQGVEQCGVHEGTGPHSDCGPDDEATEHATEREAEELGGEDEEDLVGEASLLMVEDALSGDDFGGVCASNDNVSHDSDNDVLLDIEGAGVERPSVTKGAEFFRREDLLQTFAQGQSDELGDDASNIHGGVSEGEDLVHAGNKDREKDSQKPPESKRMSIGLP